MNFLNPHPFKQKAILGLIFSLFNLAQAASPAKELNLPQILREALQRNKGQTDFVNASAIQHHFGPMFAASAGLESADNNSRGIGKRDIQESDLFKVGPEGSKILYLLSSSRGLLVIDFNKGIDKPEIIGRARPKGSFPTAMYSDETHHRLIGLEEGWNASSLTVYSVKDPTKPTRVEVLPMEGSVVDSRKVGDVLYVATKASWSYDEQKKGGKIYAFNMTKEKVEQVGEATSLEQPLTYNENMNIVESLENGKYKYYLIASLSETGWGWREKTILEVVDISDPQGKVKPLLVADAKGSVEQRSQTTIKDGALIVASQYATGQAFNSVNRYAVESFLLPTKDSVAISEEMLKKVGTDGLKDGYLQRPSGVLEKMIPNSVVTLGDSNGLSTNVKDVRYVGNTVHIHWVPEDPNKDPFDIVDIANVKDLKFVTRLQHEGYVDKSFPIQIGSKQYSIGLGWIVPIVNNEQNVKTPQLLLFEIKKQVNGSYKSVLLAQKALESAKSLWGSFDSQQDKFFELNMNADGKGSMLFPINAYDPTTHKYLSGGKLVSIDISKVDEDNDNVFTEGGTISADYGWLTRVFNNKELGKFNAFVDQYSSENLNIYGIGHQDAQGTSKDFLKPITILEIARNLVGYENVTEANTQYGLQIVAKYGNYYDEASSKTQIRLVDAKSPDAEANKELSKLELEGSYRGHLSIAEGLLVLTDLSTYDSKTREYKYQAMASLVGVKKGKASILTSVKWDSTPPSHQNNNEAEPAVRFEMQGITVLGNSQYVVSPQWGFFNALSVAAGPELKVANLNVEGFKKDTSKQATVKAFNGKLYLLYSENAWLENPAKESLNFQRNFVAPLNLNEATLSLASEAVNIPGILSFVKELSNGSTHLVCDDEEATDFAPRAASNDDENSFPGSPVRPQTQENQYDLSSVQLISSLLLNKTKAELKDTFVNTGLLSVSDLKQSGSSLFTLINGATQNNGGFWGMRSPRFRPQNDYSTLKLAALSFNKDFEFHYTTKAIRGTQVPGASLRDVFVDPRDDSKHFAVIAQESNAQIISWNDKDLIPSVCQTSVLDERGNYEKASEAFELPLRWGYWGSYYGAESKTKAVWDENAKSLVVNFALEKAGVFQVKIEN